MDNLITTDQYKQKATCPEMVLWLNVLYQAISDLRLLFAAIERNPDVSFDCIFKNSTAELKRWFNSKNIRVGSIRWICLLYDANQEKLVKKMNDDYFSKIEKITKENKPREQDFLLQKQSELLRKKEIAKLKRLASNCCGVGEEEPPTMVFSDWLSDDTEESDSRPKQPKRPTITKTCIHHGETEFSFYKRQNGKTDYKCLVCRKIYREKENEKRRKESAEMRQLRESLSNGPVHRTEIIR